MFKKFFLKKCQKTFNKHNLRPYKGLYPFCYEENKDRAPMITRQQLFVCDILLEKKIPFIIEYKIQAESFGNFYCDILAKGKYHFFDIEIDGRQHELVKRQLVRDLKKELFLLKHHNIITIRIPNKIIDNYDNEPKQLIKKLNSLKIKLEDKNFSEEIGYLKKELYETKTKH